jgi:hypothetical protein
VEERRLPAALIRSLHGAMHRITSRQVLAGGGALGASLAGLDSRGPRAEACAIGRSPASNARRPTTCCLSHQRAASRGTPTRRCWRHAACCACAMFRAGVGWGERNRQHVKRPTSHFLSQACGCRTCHPVLDGSLLVAYESLFPSPDSLSMLASEVEPPPRNSPRQVHRRPAHPSPMDGRGPTSHKCRTE